MIAAEEDGYMPNLVNELGFGRFRDLFDDLFALVPVAGIDFHLDQFVRVERNRGFLQDSFRQSRLTYDDNWFEVVRQSFQVTLLGLAELHLRIFPQNR